MKQFMPDFLALLKTLPNSCVYAITSDEDMKCLISHSNNLPARLRAIIDFFKYSNPKLEILQEMEAEEEKLLLCEWYKKDFRARGYDIVNPRQYINYTVKVQVNTKCDKVYVVLYNKRRDKTIVGEFKKMDEAKSFVEEYYMVGGRYINVIMPVYAIGDNRYIN